MYLHANQIASILEAQETIAALLQCNSSLEEIAERLEDAANFLLDVSEEISQNILAKRKLSIPPMPDPQSRYP
jgi:hypothetical protein